MLRLVSLAALLTHATAYYRAAMDVTGSVVAGGGSLTAGGKIGTYTILLQVLNPELGDLKLLLECCDDARGYASEIARKVNLNMIQGDQEESIRNRYVGDGKCSAPGPIESLAQKGKSECNYVYSFANKDWKQYEYTAQCVPSDVCSVDVVGATKGLKVAYPVVIQVLNRNAGDLFYAGQGPIGSCLEGMNQVNLANKAAEKEETSIEIFGKKIPTGFKEVMHIDGMKQLKVTDMFSKCDETSDTGVLYVFKNKFWIHPQHAMNITDFDLQQEMARRKKDLEELMNYKLPGEGEAAPEAKEEPQGLDIVAALGKLAEEVESTLEKETSVEAVDIQKDLDEAEEDIEEEEEAEKEKVEEAREELKKWEEEQKEKATEEAKEAAEELTEAPEPPKAPEVPEVPKVPELPKVEAPEPPKAPEVPKVETVADKAKKAAEDLAKKLAEEKEKPDVVEARRLEEHIMI